MNLNAIETVVAILVGIFAIIGAWVSGGKAIAGIWARWSQSRQAAALKRKALQGHYDDHTIDNSTRYYIWPKCSNIDPAHQEEISQLVTTRESLRDKVDEFLKQGDAKRHLLILADSGTGKTSFLLNYFAYNLRRPKRKRHNIALVHLGSPDCDDRIRAIEEPINTVLFLDSLDEDVKAIAGHRRRIEELMTLCKDFSHIVITCRTQFFPGEEEIPSETGIVQVGPRQAGESGVYKFWRLYLAPLDDNEVRQYLARRYPIWNYRRRRQAIEMVLKIPLLCARPMLLAHIPDIVDTKKSISTVSDLYGIMVDAWVEREAAWVNKQELRRYSEKLAVDIYANREPRGGERIPLIDMMELAKAWEIDLQPWQMSGRSLLNRDADANLKFAHRSILEYLVAKQIIHGAPGLNGMRISDQIQEFFYNMIGREGKQVRPDLLLISSMPGEYIKHEIHKACEADARPEPVRHPSTAILIRSFASEACRALMTRLDFLATQFGRPRSSLVIEGEQALAHIILETLYEVIYAEWEVLITCRQYRNELDRLVPYHRLITYTVLSPGFVLSERQESGEPVALIGPIAEKSDI